MVRSISVFVLVFLTSCISLSSEDEKLHLVKRDNLSPLLRLNGYYYSTLSGEKEELRTIFFLYRNGIILNAGTVQVSKLDEYEKLLSTKEFADELRGLKDSFGVYQIASKNIEFEMWYPGPGPPKVVFLRSGQIINDSTFRISYLSSRSEKTQDSVNELYHFKKFHPKPDSVNDFIK